MSFPVVRTVQYPWDLSTQSEKRFFSEAGGGRSVTSSRLCPSPIESQLAAASPQATWSVFLRSPPPILFFSRWKNPFHFLFFVLPGRSSLSLCCCARGQQQQSVVHSNVSLPPPPFILFSLIPFLCGGCRICSLEDTLYVGVVWRTIYICKAMLMCFPPHLSVLLTCLASPPRSVARSFFFPPSSSSWREVEYDA